MAYDVNLTLTGGEPYGTTRLVAMHVYEKAFTARNYGVGQAEALFLFLIVAVIMYWRFGMTIYYHHWCLEKEIMTLPLSTYAFYGTYSADYGTIMAGLVLTVAPILVLYLLLQKQIISGVVAGAVKS